MLTFLCLLHPRQRYGASHCRYPTTTAQCAPSIQKGFTPFIFLGHTSNFPGISPVPQSSVSCRFFRPSTSLQIFLLGLPPVPQSSGSPLFSLTRACIDFSWKFPPCLNRVSPPVSPSTIYRKVCTRNDDLEDVISRTPASRREDLVFLQNSVLGPLLEKHGLAKNTQARSLEMGR